MCDCVSITLDLEEKTLELLNRPTTVGVNVEVEDTLSSSVVLSTRLSNTIDRSDDFTVDLSKNFARQNVSKLLLSI